MSERLHSSRDPKAGITLLATLISAILLVSLAMGVQATALANTKVLKRLTAEHQAAQAEYAVRSLALPTVGEWFLGDGELQDASDDAPVSIEYDDTEFAIEFSRVREDKVAIFVSR